MEKESCGNVVKEKINQIHVPNMWKWAFLSSCVVGLLVHGFCFSNLLLNWDGVGSIASVGTTVSSGRWLLNWAGKISTNYAMPWVNGLLAVFYIALTVTLLVDLFRVRSKLLVFLTAAVFVSFPAVTATFAYMFTADCYMLALFLAVAGVYMAYRFPKWWGMAVGAICIGCSVGIYQAYLSVALVCILLLIIQQILLDGQTAKDAFFKDWPFLVILAGGMLLYKVGLALSLKLYSLTLTDYQGIGSMGILSAQEYGAAFYKTWVDFKNIFGFTGEKNLYAALQVVLLLLAVFVTVLLVKHKQVWRRPINIVISFLAIALLPICTFVINFVSANASYHMLMEMSVCFYYLLLIVLLQEIQIKKIVLSWLGAAVLLVLVFYNSLNANVNYFAMKINAEKSGYIASNILDRLEQTDEFLTKTNKVAILGDWYKAPSEYKIALTPAMTGVEDGSFLMSQDHYVVYWSTFFGVKTDSVPEEKRLALAELPEYQQMPEYPAKGCVKYIDDVMVVKLPTA